MNAFIRNALAAPVVATAGIAASALCRHRPWRHRFRTVDRRPGGSIVVRDHDVARGWDRLAAAMVGDRGHGLDRGRSFCQPASGCLGQGPSHGIAPPPKSSVATATASSSAASAITRPARVIFANERHCPVIGFRR